MCDITGINSSDILARCIGVYTCVQQVGFGRALRCTVTLSLAGEESISVVCVWVCVWKGRHRYGLCGGRLEGGGVVCCS